MDRSQGNSPPSPPPPPAFPTPCGCVPAEAQEDQGDSREAAAGGFGEEQDDAENHFFFFFCQSYLNDAKL